jgi:hypothetical protein
MRQCCGQLLAVTQHIEEEIMWQLHAAFRLGDYKTPEIDMTPALCVTLIIGIFSLIVRTGL